MQPPGKILHARYFTGVKVQQKMCNRQGYERVTGTKLEALSVDRNCRTGHVFSRIASEPHDQAGNRSRLHPLRSIGAGHGFAVRGSVYCSWQNDVGSNSDILVFERHGPDERDQRRLRRAVGPDSGPGILGCTAADRDDSSRAGFAHLRQYCPQHVEGCVDVQVEHALKGRVISIDDGSTASKAANQVSEKVDFAETANYGIDRFARRIEAIEIGGKGRKIRMIELRLLNLRG